MGAVRRRSIQEQIRDLQAKQAKKEKREELKATIEKARKELRTLKK